MQFLVSLDMTECAAAGHLMALLLGVTGASATLDAADDSTGTEYRRTRIIAVFRQEFVLQREPVLLGPLQKPALEVHLLVSYLVDVYQMFQYAPLHKPPARIVPTVEIDCTHQRFEGIAGHIAVVRLHAALILHQFVEPYLHGQFAKRIALDYLAACCSEETFPLAREVTEYYLAYNRVQNGIAQKLQPLVVDGSLAFDVHTHALVHERLAVILYMPGVEAQHMIKRAIKLPVLSEGEPYRINEVTCVHYASVLLGILLEDDACVVATEAKRIAQCSTHGALLSLVEGEIQLVVDFGIIVSLLMVDGGRHHIVLY